MTDQKQPATIAVRTALESESATGDVVPPT